MKSISKCLTPFLLVLIIFFGIFSIYMIEFSSNNQIASAEEDITTNTSPDVIVETENLDSFYSSMEIIECELAQNNTSVLDELQKQLSYYNEKLLSYSYNDKENIINLINTTEDLIAKYSDYKNRAKAKAPYHAIYTPIIAAAISYFNSKDYILAAELLTHAKNNEVLDSTYNIEHTNIIDSTSKFEELVFSTSVSGKSSFEKTGNSYDDDAFYAIHNFSYTKRMANSRTVTIIDRYDYELENEYTSIQGYVVDQMAKAQIAGALIPYVINQEITNVTGVMLNPNNASQYTETFDLATKDEGRIICLVLVNTAKLEVKFSNIKSRICVDAYCNFWEGAKHAESLANSTSLVISYDCYNFIAYALTIFIQNNPLELKDNTMTVTITCYG